MLDHHSGRPEVMRRDRQSALVNTSALQASPEEAPRVDQLSLGSSLMPAVAGCHGIQGVLVSLTKASLLTAWICASSNREIMHEQCVVRPSGEI